MMQKHQPKSVEALERRVLLSAELVCDIDPLPDASSSPTGFVQVGRTTFFAATTTGCGSELWKTDGTELGTGLVKELNPGPADGWPGWFTDLSGTLIFVAEDGVHGQELWRSDATEAGTQRFTEIYPGADYFSYNARLTSFNGAIYFTADNGTNGEELWKTDGTTAGTFMLKDIRLGSGSGIDSWDTGPFVEVNGTLYFTANDGSHGVELWKTDGTAAGTVMVHDIYPGSIGSIPVALTDVNGTLYFCASDGVTGPELWKSDGTASGTVLVKDIVPGAWSYQINWFTNVNGTLFFVADTSSVGPELWKSDGTADGTVLVKDIQPGLLGSWPKSLTNVGGTLFFSANDGGMSHGRELWKSDGTASGTVMVRDIWPDYEESNPEGLINVDGMLYFSADDGWMNHGNELWQSDGTTAGTVMVQDIYPGTLGSYPSYFGIAGGVLFFSAADGMHGTELWRVAPPVLAWDGGGDGVSWSDPLNWSQDRLPEQTDDVVISIAANPSIVVEGAQSVRSILCDEALFISTAGRLSIDQPSTFNAAVTLDGGGGAVLDGPGDVTFNGPVTWNSGYLEGSGHVIISDTASMSITGLGAHFTQRPLSILGAVSLVPGRDKVLVFCGTPAPIFGTSGRLDLTDNGMIFDYTGTSPLVPEILPLLTSGYNEGAWNGNGINSSTAASTPGHALGYSVGQRLFFGWWTDDTAIQIGYTRCGDADLSFAVELADFNRLASGFGQTGTLWTGGNFNFDNVTNLADFNLLAGNFGLSVAPQTSLARELLGRMGNIVKDRQPMLVDLL